jgi:hypothetical protein
MKSFLRIAALAVLLGFIASPVSAATISKITWDVTGGAFGGPNVGGAITGGSLTFTPATGTLATPVYNQNHKGHAFNLILNGASGSISVNFAGKGTDVSSYAGNDHINTINALAFVAHAHPAYPSIQSGGTTLSALFAYFGVSINSGVGTGYLSNYIYTSAYTSYLQTFTLGNEVRTLVPEPGTAMLLGLGLAGLGLTASGRGAIAWRRRRDLG